MVISMAPFKGYHGGMYIDSFYIGYCDIRNSLATERWGFMLSYGYIACDYLRRMFCKILLFRAT